MNLLKLIPLTAAITNIALTLFVLSRAMRAQFQRVFLLWGMSIATWSLGTFFMFHVHTPEEAMFWSKVQNLGLIFLPVSLFHISLLVCQIQLPKFLNWLYLWFGSLAVLNYTEYFTVGVRESGWAYYAIAGPGYWGFTLSYVLLTCLTIFVLFKRQQYLMHSHKARVRSLLWANAVLVIFSGNDMLPILGVDVYPFSDTPILPLGSAAAIFYGILVGYSALQHRLLDMHATLGKAAAQGVRFGFLFLITYSLLLMLNVIIGDQFTNATFFGALGVFGVSAVLTAILFPRLFGAGHDFFEQHILSERFGDRFEYHEKIREFINGMPFFKDTAALLDALERLIVQTVQVETFQLMLHDETTREFSLQRSHPEKVTSFMPNLRAESPIFTWFRESKAPHLGFNLAYSEPGETSLEHEARENVALFDPEFCFPLIVDGQAVGLLLIGGKSNGEPFTPNDLTLLHTMMNNLSLIINQMRLKQRLLLAEELELLGRMSRGMAHDLNNLLTPVSTFLQIYQEEADGEKTRELLPISLRNVGTIQSYVREALFFSENRSLQLMDVDLKTLIERVIELSDPKLKHRQVRIEIKRNPAMTVELDHVLVQRLLTNLISNAIDASVSGSRIALDVQCIEASGNQGEWARIRITDEGTGIPRENLEQIATGYFTTKKTGDENRGFGLGLAICRKIVHLHGGTLDIASREKHGTIVRIDLPLRQPKSSGDEATPPAQS
jgi:signal transduction histidine kinase